MIGILAKIFIPNSDKTDDIKVRLSYGVLCGAVGIFFNILLFGAKLFAGFVSGSIAIMADAINNLSDAGSSIITMVGFRMSGHKSDPEHPFGHGRIEYLTGLIVSMIIILMGFELLKSSIEKIINPTEQIMSEATLVILILAVIVKVYMYRYNSRIADKISSSAMRATAMDSLSDSVATSVVLFSAMISHMMNVNTDGWCGVLVSGFILFSGISSAKDTIDPLLGSKPDKEFVDKIEQYVMSNEGILGVHDLVVHDYGPGRMMISLHAEVNSNENLIEIHDTIDNIEHRLNEKLGCQAVIHMDPVVVDDEVTNHMKEIVKEQIKSIDSGMTLHDFRMVKGPTHTNLIFDVVVPYECKLDEREVQEQVCDKVRKLPGNNYAVVQIDRPFV